MTDDTLREARELLEYDDEHADAGVILTALGVREQLERVAAALAARDRTIAGLNEAAAVLRDMRPFFEWAQSYLDSGKWAGRKLYDGIKYELLERDRTIAELERCARAVWKPRATPEHCEFYAQFEAEPTVEPGTAWIIGNLGYLIDVARRTIAELRAEVAELREDRERLDWLCGDTDTSPSARFNATWRTWDGEEPWRAAIDAARAGGRDDAPR